MGVRGLQTFLEEHCSEACYSVNIEQLARDYKCKTGRDPTIVIDAQSCYKLWYKDLNWLVGYEIQEFLQRLRKFVENFKNLGIKLIFFFGGLTPAKKRSAWIQRRRKNLDEIHIIFDLIKDGTKIPKELDSIPPNMGITTMFILKHALDCQVYLSVDECDEEIVDYARKHNCFAIFGQDTDFIVSDVNDVVILSSKNFNIRTMNTLQYDRLKLARYLQIRCDQLPLLALIAGNDYIPFNMIKDFHRRLCKMNTRTGRIPFQTLMPAIGQYINRLPKNAPLEEILKIIAADISGDHNIETDVLKMSYNSYVDRNVVTDVLPEEEWDRILYVARYRHRNTTTPSILYSIISERIFECSTAFEDLRIVHDGNPLSRDQPSSSVIRPLRSRLYGVLLLEKKPPICVEEWCADNCNGYSKPVVVEPIKPSSHHPGLLALWSDNNNDRMNDIRWRLFFSSIDPTLKFTKWQSMNEDLLLTLSAYYLYNMKFLDVIELDALLATIATYRRYSQGRAQSLPFVLNLRAVHISVTFIRTYGIILTLSAACGYPVELSSKNAFPKFEGRVFQKKYAEVMQNKQNYRRNTLCEEDADCKEFFYRMRRLIIPDTLQKKQYQKKMYR